MNIALLLDLVADTLDERVALSDEHGDLTYADVRRLARTVAGELDATGTGTLAFADATSCAVPVALFGAAWAGIPYAPLNFRLPPESLREQLDRLDRPVLVGLGELTGRLGGTARPTDEWLRSIEIEAPSDLGYVPEPEAPAVVLFTSGSSGTPKAALLSHDNLLSYVMETVEFSGAGEDEALLLAAPPFHIAGVAAVLSSVYSGRRIVPLPAFTAEGWLRLARDQRATHAFVVPTMLARIVAALETDPELAVPSLRSISYGGARMAAPVLERALECFPGVGFVNAYGLTETSSTIAVLGPDEHRAALASDEPDIRRRLGSVGRPLPGVEVAIGDDPERPELPGVAGPICVRGPQVSGAYLDTESSLEDGGWLVTGDVGFVDAEGFLYVEGRLDDVIIKGGENLSPSEIEDTLLRHAAVEAAAVVGVPDPEWGETVAAAVVVRVSAGPDSDRLDEELRDWVRERLGSFKVPTRVALVDELPATATGKVLRRVVREQLGVEPDVNP